MHLIATDVGTGAEMLGILGASKCDEYGPCMIGACRGIKELEWASSERCSCAVSYTHLTLPTTPYV